MAENESLWELYGLKTNPFATSPLLVKGGLLPIDCFHGRADELTRLNKIFASAGGSRILVYGDVGVGKTSFVNYARYGATKKGHFTPFKEIGVQGDWDANSFIMNTLYAIYSTMKLQRKQVLDSATLGRLEGLVDITNTRSVMTGMNVAGFGINFDRTHPSSKSSTMMAIMDFFQDVIQEIVEKTGRDIIIHYNNLERIPETATRKLFEDLRDFFQTDNVHFVFVGNLTVNNIFQSMPRVSSIMSDTPIVLNEFLLDDIEEIIRKRIYALKIPNLNPVPPYNKEAIETLYGLYGGNIRNILNSMSTAIIEIADERPVILNKNLLANTLRFVVEKRYLSKQPPRAKDVLQEMVKHDEITNRHLSAKLNIARSNVSTYVRELEKAGCIFLRRKDGKDKYWSVEAKIKWMLLQPDDNLQKAINDFMV